MRTLIFGSFTLAMVLMLGAFAKVKDSTVHAGDTMTTTLFIAGDSTATKLIDRPHQGWGAVLGEYFNQKQVKIDNRALGGRSSRTFITQGHWQKLLDDVRSGDTVLIQFGHNDVSPINDETRARGVLPGIGEDSVDIDNMLNKTAETVYSYGHYIRKMIVDTRAKKATPILISLTVRNLWQDERIERGLGQYNAWLYKVAIEQNTQFIDITNPMADQLETIGIDKTSLFYPEDHTHFSTAGAHLYAQAVVAGLQGLRLAFKQTDYSNLGKNVQPALWSWLRLPFVADPDKPSIFFVGDSTVRNGGGIGKDGGWGWGDFVEGALHTDKFNIINRAIGARSSRTYITQGHWQRSLNMMNKGDYVLIQFGHNDAGPLNDDSRARGTIAGIGQASAHIKNLTTGKDETVHTYGWYLRKMIGEAKARGIRPIVVSPVPRKIWQGTRIKRDQSNYPGWARSVAQQSNSLFIDLHTLVAQKYDLLGQEGVNELFADEHTHTNLKGAKLTARVVAKELEKIFD